MLKKIILFILCLAPWFINNLFPLDYQYYDIIKKPFFAPPQLFYPIAWTIVYILIAITIFQIINSYKWKNVQNNYKITLLINYLLNQSYTILFFGIKNNFLGFISCLGILISTLFLKEETSLMNNKISKLLFPYLILSIFATILSLSIYLLNN